MESYSGAELLTAFAGGILAGLLVGALVASASARTYHHQDAISRGVARYHPETGAWEWTVEKKAILPEKTEAK